MKFPDGQAGLHSLNKGWKFKEYTAFLRPGGDDRTIESAHSEIYDATKGGEKKGPVSGTFDDGDWENITLPHDWVTRKDFDSSQTSSGGYKERGIAWYRINFGLSCDDRKKQILLEFEGMSADAVVYVNGFLMTRSFSGYTPFSVDITDVANFGMVPNTLAVYIDARGWEGWWYEGAGIYRNCWLIKKPAVHAAYDGVFIKPVKKEDGWFVEIEAEIENSFGEQEDFTLSAEIKDNAGAVIKSHSEVSGIGGFTVKKLNASIPFYAPVLWDINNPYMYTAVLSIESRHGTDFIKIPFGFRTIGVCPETGFYLNGSPVKLLGMCCHQDHAGVGVAVPYAIKEYRVRLLKEMGANAYRCAHNTDPEILDICDRLGMLVMEENRTFSPERDTVRNLTLMVRHSRNHPSVVMYSIFNEEPTAGNYKGYLITGRLRAAVIKNDDTRFITCAMNGGYMEPSGAVSVIDVAGINYHPQSYAEFHKKFPDKPLVGSETAASFSVRGEWKTDYNKNTVSGHDDDCAPWSNHVRTMWKSVASNDFVMGTFVWTGFDYRGEPTPFQWPSVSSFFGTYDNCGFPKDAVYLYRAFWKKEPVIHIVPHWNLPVEEGTEVKVRVFTNCEFVTLFINGKLFAERESDIFEQTLFIVPYEKGEVTASGYINGAEAARETIQTSKAPSRLKIELSRDAMRADGFDAIAVNIMALDEDGLFVPDAQNLIRFAITGGAEIAGVGNGNPNSHEPDFADYRHLFNGRCQAVIKSNRMREKISVTASAEGLQAAGAEIAVIHNETDSCIPVIETIYTKVINGWRMYKEIFDEMPDPGLQAETSDNNSFEPVIFDYESQALLDNKLGKYALYKVYCDFGHSIKDKTRYLCFNRVTGVVWVYIDGKLAKEEDCRYGGKIEFALPETLAGKHAVTVILRHMHEYWPYSGIYDPVIIKEYPRVSPA